MKEQKTTFTEQIADRITAGERDEYIARMQEKYTFWEG